MAKSLKQVVGSSLGTTYYDAERLFKAAREASNHPEVAEDIIYLCQNWISGATAEDRFRSVRFEVKPLDYSSRSGMWKLVAEASFDAIGSMELRLDQDGAIQSIYDVRSKYDTSVPNRVRPQEVRSDDLVGSLIDIIGEALVRTIEKHEVVATMSCKGVDVLLLKSKAHGYYSVVERRNGRERTITENRAGSTAEAIFEQQVHELFVGGPTHSTAQRRRYDSNSIDRVGRW